MSNYSVNNMKVNNSASNLARCTFKVLLSLVVCCAGFTHSLHAAIGQHSDVMFWYENGKIVTGLEGGNGVGTGNFPTSGLFQQFNSNPGFASETDLGLGINPGDLVAYNVLDSLFYWADGQFQQLDPDVHIRINNNSSPDTLVDGSSSPQPGGFSPSTNIIGVANANGDFHSHVDFLLEPMQSPGTFPYWGAYGLKLSLTTHSPGIDDSNPFFFVFNFGLNSTEFSTAVDAFSELLVPSFSGDFDGDGIVDGHDFLLWQRIDGSPQGLADWQNNFGSQDPSNIAVVTIIPEPGTVVLMLIGVAVIVIALRPGVSATLR